jgi:phosphate-selective porin
MKAAARNPNPATVAVDAAMASPVDPFDRLPAFSWGGTVVVGFAIFGAVVGPDRMIDGFMNVLKVEGEISRAASRS